MKYEKILNMKYEKILNMNFFAVLGTFIIIGCSPLVIFTTKKLVISFFLKDNKRTFLLSSGPSDISAAPERTEPLLTKVYGMFMYLRPIPKTLFIVCEVFFYNLIKFSKWFMSMFNYR